MTYDVQWTALALREFNGILDSVSEYSASYAVALQEKADRFMLLLEDNPRLYRESRYMTGCRDIVVDNYLFIYRVDDDAREVHILRAFHGARDIAALLL